ncbi:hypothetical protein [Ureibacillus sp. FSL K6-3587]|jgi:hypothetical protein|uniref:hypothetical protein n=1 Tax=Ureibacillus sp. FSL K6-3587 TaxID=2954681 RepID=UPI003158AC26
MRAMGISMIFLLVLLFGCQQQDNAGDPEPVNGETPNGEENGDNQNAVEEEPADELELSQFLKPDGSTAKFLGDGNEFASYTEKTTWLDDQYVGTIVDNGGVTMMTIYKIGDEKIEIVYKEPVDLDAAFPDMEDIKSMQPIETYFAKPIEVGTSFGNWKIIKIDEPVETPYKNFDEAIVIEESGENYVNRKYFVEGLGEVKTEYIMDTDQGEKYIVTSTLESVSTEDE